MSLKRKFTEMSSSISDGPFFATMEESLKACRVKRQAYQGGTFVGNHVHKLLKVIMIFECYTITMLGLCIIQLRSIRIITTTIEKTAENKASQYPSLLQEGKGVAEVCITSGPFQKVPQGLQFLSMYVNRGD